MLIGSVVVLVVTKIAVVAAAVLVVVVTHGVSEEMWKALVCKGRSDLGRNQKVAQSLYMSGHCHFRWGEFTGGCTRLCCQASVISDALFGRRGQTRGSARAVHFCPQYFVCCA